jgi:hypothetical protein
MNKKHVKLFERFDLGDDSYTEVIDNVLEMVDVYNAPKTDSKGKPVDEDSELILHKVIVNFDLQVIYKRSGIDGVIFSLKSVALDGAVIDYDENEQDSFDIIDDNIELERYDSEMGGFPLYIDTLQIDMNNSFDTKNWTYSINIGHFG